MNHYFLYQKKKEPLFSKLHCTLVTPSQSLEFFSFNETTKQ